MTRDPAAAKVVGGAALALVAAATVALAAGGWRRGPAATPGQGAETRRLHAAAAALSASVLVDSAIEHDRGSFENPGMVAPLVASLLAGATGAEAALGARLPPRLRGGAYALALAVGAAGFGFHAYNLLRQPGGLSWLNLFYAAPIGAPGALGLAGAIGLAADRAVDADTGAPTQLLGMAAGRALCGLVAGGLAGTVGEVALLHYRGSFQNPFMWLPVALPPLAAALVAKAAIEPPGRRRRGFARAWLRLTVALGMAGVGFHAWGVSRAMGGWSNWRQNVLDGPPLPAPPSFSALAAAGLAALRLRDREDA